MVRLVILFWCLLLQQNVLWASSCCGNSTANFQVLNNYENWSLEVVSSWFKTKGRVLEDSSQVYGYWNGEKRDQQVTALSLARTFSDRWQGFLNGRYFQNSFHSNSFYQSFAGVSDVQGGVTYNLWPQYTYSIWHPDIYLSLIVNIPNGNSIYNSLGYREGIGVTGYNQWGHGLGLTLFKSWQPWQARLQMKVLHILGKSFGEIDVSNFFEGTVSGLISYNFPYITFNMGWTHEFIENRTVNYQETGRVSVTSAQFGLLKTMTDVSKIVLQYTDQSLLGPAKNTYINSGLSVGWIQNF